MKKKLLLLGGSSYILPVIEACKKHNITVYTADYLPDNIAHKYSDGYFNVSVVDKEAVLSLAKELKVDGINAFATDAGVKTMAYVAEKLNLPCVANYSAVEILQDKPKFRKFLKDNNFLAPMFESYTSYDDAIKNLHKFHLPVMVKPADSAGSKGVTKVESLDQFEDACAFALRFSTKKEFIVEEFIENVGPPSDTDSFSIDGVLTHFTLNNQYFDKNSPGEYAPCAYVYPTIWPPEKKAYLHDELQRLISLLGLKTSVYNIESRIARDGNVYIMEVSPRGGGNRLSEMIRYIYGVDFIEATVLHSVGLPFKLPKLIKTADIWVEIILHSNIDGIYEGLIIDENIKNCIVELDVLIKPGDKVEAFSAANKMVGTAILKIDSSLDNHVRNNIHNLVKVKVK